jgi:cysteine desulfurase
MVKMLRAVRKAKAVASRPIYLDYAATSPVDARVAEAMAACLTQDGDFANPASPHAAGSAARRVVDLARERIGALVNAAPGRLVFTSGATEANNLALRGMLAGGGQLVTTRIEHRSVLDPAEALAARGVELCLVDCDREGIVAPARIAAAISARTRLVSVMQVNNEIGSVQDIAAIATICREADVPLHVDAAQGAGKVPLDIEGWGIDLCSLTAHKLNGPKGVGALYVRPGLALEPLISGGEAQLGVRAGTLPTHQIAGFGKAFELAAGPAEAARLGALRERLWLRLGAIPGTRRNGSRERSAPHILNVSFPGVEGESLRLALEDLAVSAGSACTSRSAEPSHVLRSLGLSDVLAESSLRFGVGRFTTEDEIDRAADRVMTEVTKLRQFSEGAPAWCSS